MIEDENMPLNTGIAGDFEGYKKGVLGKAFFKDKDGRYQSASVEDVQLPEQGWAGVAGPEACEHNWICRHPRAKDKHSAVKRIETCSLCAAINWDLLEEDVQKWGWAQRVSNDVSRAALSSPVRKVPLSATPPIEVELNADEAVGKRLADGTCSKCTRPWDEDHEKRRAAYEKHVADLKDTFWPRSSNQGLPVEAIPANIHLSDPPPRPNAALIAATEEANSRLLHERWLRNDRF